MNRDEKYIGIVENGQLSVLTRDWKSWIQIMLTKMGMQVNRPPASEEIDLSRYEGRAIMIRRRDGGIWIYSANLIDEAGPIVAALVEKIFGQEQS